MTDFLDQGATWTRQVTVKDGAGTLTDLSPVVGCLCPETPLTVTHVSTGVYNVSLAAATTGALCPGPTHWELMGQAGSSVLVWRYPVIVVATCVRLP